MSHTYVTLKVEHFYHDEDLDFRISSKIEMHAILHDMAVHGSRVALFYGRGQSFVLTTLLWADEQGMWLDIGPFPPDNKQILLSEKIIFVSAHQNVKIQFTSNNIKSDLFEGDEAFYMSLPDYLLRLQRRAFFRSLIPSTTLIRCVIPIPPAKPEDELIMRAVPILDISCGGVALLCKENESTLLPEAIFPDCQISIPDVGILSVDIEVRYCIDITSRNNLISKRVGCRFLGLDNQSNILLQRYITRLQSESLVRP